MTCRNDSFEGDVRERTSSPRFLEQLSDQVSIGTHWQFDCSRATKLLRDIRNAGAHHNQVLSLLI